MSTSPRSGLAVRRPGLRDVFNTIPLLLIGLKLAGVIPLSWWWVLAPIWIGFLPAILILGGLLTLYLTGRCRSLWQSTRGPREPPRGATTGPQGT
ncbi:MAG TPA: hypothetical protein VMF87_09060 [Streptosporangiaceae bacterium]|nr:hypothetical protein [Streptosporangiaceae bacterium]